MAVLDYTSASQSRSGEWRWAVAITIGATVGFGVAVTSYEPVLRMLARGMQLEVFDVAEPFEHQARFSAAMALSGAVVGCSAVSARRVAGRGSVAVWVLSFAACFIAGAAVGLFYARSRWNPATGSPHAGFSGSLSLASAPSLAAPVAGCMMVLVVLGLIVLRRVAAARPAE